MLQDTIPFAFQYIGTKISFSSDTVTEKMGECPDKDI